MVRKFIELQEVAALFGVSPDQLSEMRSRGDIYGYRDGTTWKFKIEEVQRVATDRGIQISEAALAGDVPVTGDSFLSSEVDIELNALSNVDEIETDEGGESVLVTDGPVDSTPKKKSSGSTVIGEKDELASESGSDLKLASAPNPSDTGSDLELVAPSSHGGDVLLDAGDSSALSDASDALKLEGEDSPGSVAGSRVEGMSGDLNLDMAGSVDFASGESLSLGESDLQLADSSDVIQGGSPAESPSSDLALEGEDDLVLGSSMGSDVTLSPGDSGISLSSPSDTGLSLTDGSLDVGGAESAMELPDEIVTFDEEPADPAGATQFGADGDFLLTPIEESPEEESDSGSQVIALDTDESYDEEAATLLGTDASIPITEAESSLAMPAAAAVTAPTISPPAAALETPYTIMNVLCLAGIFLFLTLTGMFMFDLLRHMWSWDEPYTLNSRMMDWILGVFGG